MANQVVLRFYGRFVFGRELKNGGGPSPEPTGLITVMAPKFEQPHFEKHHPLMSIRRDLVVFREPDDSTESKQVQGKSLTTLQPRHRMVTDTDPLQTAEYYLWDLVGLTVRFKTSGRARLRNGAAGQLISLNELEASQNREARLDPAALKPTDHGVTLAAVQVNAGDGIASVTDVRDRIEIIRKESKEPVDDPKRPGQRWSFQAADLVEIFVNVPPSRPLLELELVKPDGAIAGTVTVRTDTVAVRSTAKAEVVTTTTTTVAFSHLCSCLPKALGDEGDLEFAQYYALLQPDSKRQDGLILIPRVIPHGAGEGGDCDKMAEIDYL